jgi:hexaprenyl-diphosphate synthase
MYKWYPHITKARELVLKSDGIERTRKLAGLYCQAAINDLSILPPSDAKTALIQLTTAVLDRKK